jgi:phasin family protein
MSSAAEQFGEICKANLDAARQFAALSLDGAENILKVQLQAAREVLAKDSEQLSTLWLGISLSKALTAWPEFYQGNTQKALDAARAYMDGAAKAQGEFARLFQDQVAVANKSFIESVQGLTGAAGAAKSAVEHVEHRPRKVA